MLRGPRLSGGSLSGGRFFLDCFALLDCSASEDGPPNALLEGFLIRALVFVGSNTGVLDTVPVEELWRLLVSAAWLDLTLSRKDMSAEGPSLGDS